MTLLSKALDLIETRSSLKLPAASETCDFETESKSWPAETTVSEKML